MYILMSFRTSGGPPQVFADSQAVGRYLDLEQLGNVLHRVLPGKM